MSLKEKLKQVKVQDSDGIGVLEDSKNLWINDCENIMSQIKNWIDSYVLEGLAFLKSFPIEINEEKVKP